MPKSKMEEEICIDISIIEKKADENHRIYQELKRKILSIPEGEFDSIVHPLAEKISEKINCTQCGNCCKQLNPPVREDEIERLSEKKKCSKHEFSSQFLHRNENQSYYFFKKKPCIFLDETRCSVYENRPDSCADYPHLISSGQKFRFGRTIEQAGICPIA